MGAFTGFIDTGRNGRVDFDIDSIGSMLAPYGAVQRLLRYGSTAVTCQNAGSEFVQNSGHRQKGQDLEVLLDGTIYNCRELAESLGRDKQPESLDQIRELLLAGFGKWGTGLFERLNGDWAIALLDINRHRLLLARDPFGGRPLFYSVNSGRVFFSSLARFVASMSGRGVEIDEAFAFSILGLVPFHGPISQYSGVFSVSPGSWVEIGNERVTETRFYSVGDIEPLRGLSDRQYEGRFREMLWQSVSRRVAGERSASAYLSSGLDSSTVCAVAAAVLEQKGGTLNAFTAAPRSEYDWKVRSGWHGDESSIAATVASRRRNITHNVIPTIQGNLLASMRQDIKLMDRPSINPCNMGWVNAIRSAASQLGTKVVLTGTMGNVTISFQGYNELFRLVRGFKFIAWCRAVNEFIRVHPRARWRAMAQFSLAPFLPASVWKWSQNRRGRLLELSDYSAIKQDFANYFRSSPKWEEGEWSLSHQPIADSRVWRAKLLSGFDRGPYNLAADAWGIQLRDPTVDRDLVNFCISLPDSQFLKAGQPRSILLRALSGVLPAEVLECRTRGYQAPDWPVYLLSESSNLLGALEEARSGSGAVEKFVDVDSLIKDLAGLPRDGFHSRNLELRYRQRLLRGISFALWAAAATSS